MTYIIYGLFDPRQVHAIRYIGFTARVDSRLKSHISEAKKSHRNTHKLNWIRSLLAEGVSPVWKQLDSVDNLREAAKREIELIRQYLDSGAALTNGTKGGDGSVLWTPLMSQTRSEISTAYWSSEEAREQQKQAMNSHWSGVQSEEHRQIIVDTNKRIQTGRKRSEETKEKMRQAKLGKPQMPRTKEWAAKISAAQKGIKRGPRTPEQQARHTASMQNPETRAKMSAAAKARVR
jgi:hypothetical protein